MVRWFSLSDSGRPASSNEGSPEGAHQLFSASVSQNLISSSCTREPSGPHSALGPDHYLKIAITPSSQECPVRISALPNIYWSLPTRSVLLESMSCLTSIWSRPPRNVLLESMCYFTSMWLLPPMSGVRIHVLPSIHMVRPSCECPVRIYVLPKFLQL